MKEQFIKNLVIAVGIFIDGMRKDMGLHPDTECVGCIMTPGPDVQTQVPPAVTSPGSQPPAPPAVTATGDQPQAVELDSQGIPWDARIHSSGKTKYASRIDDNKPEGGWVIKKGADINEVIRIREEYLSTAPGSQPQVPPAVTAPGSQPQVPPAVTAPGSQTQVPPAVTAPGSQPQVPPAVTAPGSQPQAPPAVTAPGSQPQAPPAVTAPGSQPQAPPAVTAPGSQPQVPPTTWGQLMRAIVEADIDRSFVESVCSRVAQCSWADLQAEAKKHLIPEIAVQLGFK